jgi:hypothetical protein
MSKVSYMGTVRAFAEDAARAQVFGGAPHLQSYGQTSYMLGVGTVRFRNAIDKLVPQYVAKFQAEKIKNYIRFLEKQGYTVLSPEESKELETFPGDICDLNLAIDAMRKADAAIE